MKSFFEFIVALAIVAGIGYAISVTGKQDAPVTPRDADTAVKVEPFTYVITGDIMLGRNVRNLMRANGDWFPFLNVGPIFANADAVVANLEGPITNRENEPENDMHFSFDPSSAQALASAGVTHVTIANNHALDQGQEGRADTRKHLADAGVEFFGDTWGLDVGTAAHIRPAGHDVAFLGIDDTITRHDIEDLADEITSFGTSTHIVAFMHWGEEYELEHSERQEMLAHKLVDAGIDAVIGSHPHVVQDIEVYNGAPIFYSLGNFIFDQYWDTDVETGLTLRVTHDNDTYRYELVPVVGNHSQPKLMGATERQAFLDALADRSQPELADAIKAGVIEL